MKWKKLFERYHDIVKQIGEVVQLLLTESFTEIKFCWLANICNLSPNIDAWGRTSKLRSTT